MIRARQRGGLGAEPQEDLFSFSLRAAQPAPPPAAFRIIEAERPDILIYGVAAGTTQRERRTLNERVREILAKRDEDIRPEELLVLARYSGTGGIGDSRTEFYTDQAVAGAVWQILANAGFDTGDVLEPSCGAGVFLHTAPTGARITGIELDPTSARIARLLHRAAGHEVHASSLERFATVHGRTFGAVVGNVPFAIRGDLIRQDKPFLPRAELYFLDTAIDLTRDRGLVALIVPTGILDSQGNREFRERLLRKAEFLGAQRLPNTAFEGAHTSVTSDIVVFQRRPQVIASALSALTREQVEALGIADEEFVSGGYFSGRGAANIRGRMEPGWRAKAQMGADITVTGPMDGVPEALAAWTPDRPSPAFDLTLDQILAGLEDDGERQRVRSAALKPPYQPASAGDIRTIAGQRHVLDGTSMRWVPTEAAVPVAVQEAIQIGQTIERLAGRDGWESSDAERQDLSAALDRYVSRHGLPGQNAELRAWLSDPHLPAAPGADADQHGAEVVRQQHAAARLLGAIAADGSYSDLVTGRRHDAALASIETLAEVFSLDEGGFTVEVLARQSGMPVEAVEEHLADITRYAVLPDGKTFLTMDAYVAGELWARLDAARAGAADASLPHHIRERLQGQAETLDRAIAPKSLEDVEVQISSGFITADDLTAWFRSEGMEHAAGFSAVHDGTLWLIRDAHGMAPDSKDQPELHLLRRMLNRDGVRRDQADMVTVLHDRFRRWLLTSERRAEVEDRYNRQYRGFRAMPFSRSPLNVPGLVGADRVNDYHWPSLHWALSAGKGIVADDVGLGKSLRALMLSKMLVALGRAKKPIIIVPKSILMKWATKEIPKWFPGASVLTIGETLKTDRHGNVTGREDNEATRQEKLQQLAQNHFDFVLVSEPVWNTIDVDPATKARFAREDFWNRHSIALGRAGTKQTAKILEAHEQAVATREFGKRETTIYFNALGVDAFLLDEAHKIKNRFAARARLGEQSPKFLGGSGLSNRAQDSAYKARVVREANDGKNVYLFTASPTRNSPLEIYSMISHVAPEAFERVGIRNSEDFLDRFCVFELQNTLTLEGNIEEGLVTAGFKNLDELRQIIHRYISRQTAEQVGLIIPRSDERQHVVEMTPRQKEVYERLREQASGQADKAERAHIFSIMDQMQKASLDLGLLDPSMAGEFSPKIEKCADEVARYLPEGGQLIFCESLPCHERIADALVRRGIPRDQIAILNAAVAQSSSKRQKIFDAYNSGKVRVIIANCTAEEGADLQNGTTDIHNADFGWDPEQIRQRRGRGLRQGNDEAVVRSHFYMAKGSFDGYRWQTLVSKQSWLDVLWNGGDRVENPLLPKLGAEDMLLMFSADPEAARQQIQANREAFEQRQSAEGRGQANEIFVRFQEMAGSLRSMRRRGETGGAVDRLARTVANLRDQLGVNRWFRHKQFLQSDEQVYVEPVTDTAWTVGDGFTLQPGQSGPLGLEPPARRWVVTGMGHSRSGKAQILARPWGQENGEVFGMDADAFRAGVEKVAHDPAQEAAHIEAEKRAAAEQKVIGVKTLKEICELPRDIVEARADELHDLLRESVRKNTNHNDFYGGYAMAGPHGELVFLNDYNAQKALDTHRFILPIEDDRDVVMDAFVNEGMRRMIKGNPSQSMSRRRTVNYHRDPDWDGIQVTFEERESYTNRLPHNNKWEAVLERLFGKDTVVEAKQALLEEALGRIEHSYTFKEAMRNAQPAVRLDQTHRVIPSMWPVEILDALRAKAEEFGVLDQPIAEAVGVKYPLSEFKTVFVPRELFEVQLAERRYWGTHSRTADHKTPVGEWITRVLAVVAPERTAVAEPAPAPEGSTP